MHQIRLHFSQHGYPVAWTISTAIFHSTSAASNGLRRQFLHASKVALEYHGKKQIWTASPPADLSKTLELLTSD
jgi:23S rRNA-/tRNA-specific pseudouridylate synthase